MALAGQKDEVDEIAQRVDEHHDLGGQTILRTGGVV